MSVLGVACDFQFRTSTGSRSSGRSAHAGPSRVRLDLFLDLEPDLYLRLELLEFPVTEFDRLVLYDGPLQVLDRLPCALDGIECGFFPRFRARCGYGDLFVNGHDRREDTGPVMLIIYTNRETTAGVPSLPPSQNSAAVTGAYRISESNAWLEAEG